MQTKADVRRMCRDIRNFAYSHNMSNAVIVAACGCLKAGSPERAIEAGIEHVIEQARAAKRCPDLIASAKGFKDMKSRLWKMGFDGNQIEAILRVPKTVSPKSTSAPARAKAKTAAPTRARPTVPAKNTARVSAPRSAQSTTAQIQQRKRSINERLRKEERGAK